MNFIFVNFINIIASVETLRKILAELIAAHPVYLVIEDMNKRR